MNSEISELALKFISSIIKNTEWENKVFLAGGGVRSKIMGMPVKDIDLVILGPNAGIEFAEWITKKLNIKEVSNPVIFPRFGTAKFNLKNIIHDGIDISHIPIECVMTRKEEYHDGSRNPDVTPGTLQEDIERRDFAINSLLQNISTGEILDLSGIGIQDIKNKVVKTILDPDIIFKEDPLRMMRAIRFVCKLNFTLPLSMLKAIKLNSSKLQIISKQRIQDELNEILLNDLHVKGIRLLIICGLMEYIIPEFLNLKNLEQNHYHHLDVMDHSLEVLKKTPKRLIPRLAALLHDIGKYKTKTIESDNIHFYMHESIGAELSKDILKKLGYSNIIVNSVSTIIYNHMRLKGLGDNVSKTALRKLKRSLGDDLDNLLDVIHADNISHTEFANKPNQIPTIKSKLKDINEILDKQHLKLPLNGAEIQLIFSLKPGSIIGELLKVLEEKWMETPLITKEESINLLTNYLNKKMIKPLEDRVVIKSEEAEEKSPGGLYIPDVAKEKPMKGEIVAVGPGKKTNDDKFMEMNLKVGDKVLYGKYSGTEINIGNETYLIMREADIFAKF